MTQKDIIKEQIMEVLTQHPCLTAKEIAFFIKRTHGGDLLSPQTISGILRPFYTKGTIGKDSHDGKTVYWIVGIDEKREV